MIRSFDQYIYIYPQFGGPQSDWPDGLQALHLLIDYLSRRGGGAVVSNMWEKLSDIFNNT